MDAPGNFDRSFGAPYYKSADYQMRYPAYLKPVVAPPPAIINVHGVLHPKQFVVRKTIERPEKFLNLVAANRPVVGDTISKRKTARKKLSRRRRARVNDGVCTAQSLSGDGVRAAGPSVDNRDDQVYPDKIHTVHESPADNNYIDTPRSPTPTPSLTVPSRPLTADPAQNDDNNPTQYPFPILLTTDQREHNSYYPDLPNYPSPPPSPPAPPPPPPPTEKIYRKSAGTDDISHDNTIDPLELFRQTAKLFDKECQKRRLSNVDSGEKTRAKIIAEEAKNVAVTMAAIRGWSDDTKDGRKVQTTTAVAENKARGGSEYAELERLGLGKCDDGGRWVPNSNNRLKNKLMCFQ